MMWKKLEEYRKKYQMFATGDVVVAGISGGADSMCLLCVLDVWRKELEMEVIVVHVNHGLRGEIADQEEAYVKKVCEERAIPFEAYHYAVSELAKQERRSEEEMGRILRRRAFEETAEKYGAGKIALAHHKDDNAETFLFHLARGSRLKGLGGMRPVNGKYVRPLLALERKEIEEYLQQEGITYCSDLSNDSDCYTRNRIRRHVIPYLREQVNEQAVEHMNQAMEHLREVQVYLEEQMAMLWKEVVVPSDNGLLVLQSIAQASPLLRKMLFRKVMTEVSGKERDILEVHVEALEELLVQQTGRCRSLPYQMKAYKTYQGVNICKEEKELEALPEVYLSGKDEVLEYGGYQVEIRVLDAAEENKELPKKRFTKWFDYDIISESVCIRGRKAEDRIVISENGSSQKVKQFLINEKVPREIRNQIPIVAEGKQVLWIVGYRQSKAYQVTAQTKKILEIKFNGGNEDGR